MKSTGVMDNQFHGRSGGNNEAGGTGKEDGVRPEEGVEPGREPGVEHMKGENGFWKSARDIIPMVVLYPYVRRRHSTGPSGHSVIDPARSSSPPFPPSPCSCLEANPPNIVPPLTSNPPSHSSIIITIIISNNNKSNILPLTLPIPKTRFHAPSLSNPDQTWISSQILSSSPLLPLPLLLLCALLPSAEIQPSRSFLVSPNRTAALPVAHPALPPLHLATLAMVVLPHLPSRSYHRSSLLPLLPTSTNGVSLRPPSPTL